MRLGGDVRRAAPGGGLAGGALARRLEWKGIQEWLSFYFKSPMAQPGLQPEHDLFIQATKLKSTLRVIAGEEPLTHLGLDYYGEDLPL